jgi:hypothetical protein
MTSVTFFGIAGQLLAVTLVGAASGDIILRFLRVGVVPEGDAPGVIRWRPIWFGAPERLLLGLVGFVAFSCALMVLHIATSGWVFSSSVGPVIAVLALLGWCAYLRRAAPRPSLSLPPARRWVAPALLVAAILALFIVPVFVAGSSVRTGDPPWHLGWTEQILGGDRLPTGPAPELARNAYPWGLHATMATMTRLVPGTDPLTALESLHVLIAFGIPLAAAGLARRVGDGERVGLWAAWAASLVGGWAWLQTQDATFIPSPRDAHFGADLVAASPNSAYELLAPALPRELGLILLAAGATLLVHYMRTHDARAVFAGGAVVGLAGIVSLPMFIVGLVWMAALALVHAGGKRRMFLYSAGASFLALSVWFAPVALQFVRHGGFVNITPRLGVEWPLGTALMSWGVLLPLAALGAFLVHRARRTKGAAVLALTVASCVLLGLGIMRSEMGWDLAGNATLLHQGRFWPPLHLLAAVLAGQAAAALVGAGGRSRSLVAAALVLLGLPSMFLAARGIVPLVENRTDGFEYSSPDIRSDDAFVRRAADVLGPQDVVLVVGSDRLAFRLFEFSGVRLAAFDHPDLDGNDLRIRYRDLATEWDLLMNEGGFAPDYVAVSYDGVGTLAGDDPVATGSFAAQTWGLFEVEPGDIEGSL